MSLPNFVNERTQSPATGTATPAGLHSILSGIILNIAAGADSTKKSQSQFMVSTLYFWYNERMKSKYKLIYLEWADTVSPVDNGWKSESEALKWFIDDDYWVCQTGFLIKEDKKFICLAGRYNITTSNGHEVITLGELTKIPITWIRNRKNLV